MEEVKQSTPLKNLPFVVLAAGKSSRMTSPKGLLDFRGQPWLLEQLTKIGKAGSAQSVVVLGEDRDKYFKAIPFLKKQGQDWGSLKVSCVVNENPERGPFSSLSLALQYLIKENAMGSGVFILPVDVPLVEAKDLGTLAQNLKGPVKAVVPTCQGMGGHPVLLSKSFAMSLLTLPIESPESRLDVQLRLLHESQLKRVVIEDERTFKNLNTMEEWDGFLKTRPRTTS